MSRNLDKELFAEEPIQDGKINVEEFGFVEERLEFFRSAFRPYNKIMEEDEQNKIENQKTIQNISKLPSDLFLNPLENYVFKHLNSLFLDKTEVGKLVYAQHGFSQTLTVDVSPSYSSKFQQSKNEKIEEVNLNLKNKHHNKLEFPFVDKKCCKCKKSRCLMLYCECFRAGQLCQGCNCLNCLNTIENNAQRLSAMKGCLQLNPLAFAGNQASKFQKGCKCRKSGCKKGYCQCFQQGKSCSQACICEGCQNHDGHKQGSESNGLTLKKGKSSLLSI